MNKMTYLPLSLGEARGIDPLFPLPKGKGMKRHHAPPLGGGRGKICRLLLLLLFTV
jgi:hypothetical protein